MAPRTRSFESARSRHLTIKRTSTADIGDSIIAETVPGTAGGTIPFSPQENPLRTLWRELRQRSETLLHGGVCLGGNSNVGIDARTISEIVASPEGVKIIVKALARGIVAEALVLEVAEKISSKGSQARRMAGKVVDLKDKLASQKLELEALQSIRREVTPATILTAGSSAPVIKKKKSLDHPKRLSNGKDPSFEF